MHLVAWSYNHNGYRVELVAFVPFFIHTPHLNSMGRELNYQCNHNPYPSTSPLQWRNEHFRCASSKLLKNSRRA